MDARSDAVAAPLDEAEREELLRRHRELERFWDAVHARDEEEAKVFAPFLRSSWGRAKVRDIERRMLADEEITQDELRLFSAAKNLSEPVNGQEHDWEAWYARPIADSLVARQQPSSSPPTSTLEGAHVAGPRPKGRGEDSPRLRGSS